MKPQWSGNTIIPVGLAYCLCTTEKMFHKELKGIKCPLKPFDTGTDAATHFLYGTEESDVLAVVTMAVTDDPSEVNFSMLGPRSCARMAEDDGIIGRGQRRNRNRSLRYSADMCEFIPRVHKTNGEKVMTKRKFTVKGTVGYYKEVSVEATFEADDYTELDEQAADALEVESGILPSDIDSVMFSEIKEVK